MSRVPLRENSINIYGQPPFGNYHAHQGASKRHEQRLVQFQAADEASMKEWRSVWREVIRSSRFYFDQIDQETVERVKIHLYLLGAKFAPFFDKTVSHVVTKRPIDGPFPPGKQLDVLQKAKALDIRIWSCEKLIRFLTYLLGHSPLVPPKRQADQNLGHLLREEKYLGNTDRDPSARRDNFHHFEGPYLLVWDPTHYNRPLIRKEYNLFRPGAGDWPRLGDVSGRGCPFVLEDIERHEEEKKKRKLVVEGDDAHKHKRLKEETIRHNKSHNHINNNHGTAYDAAGTPDQISPLASVFSSKSAFSNGPLPVPPPHGLFLTTGSSHSLTGPTTITNKYGEISASGLNQSMTSVAARSIERSGPVTGLPNQMASRELANLQRKVLNKPVRLSGLTPSVLKLQPDYQHRAAGIVAAAGISNNQYNKEDKRKSNAKKKSYCENCQVKYDSFPEHVQSRKHRAFAMDPANFIQLDRIIEKLERYPRLA